MEEQTAVDIQALHANSEIRKVALSDLKVDRSYQRDPSQGLVDDIANNWDEVSAELLLVSDRGESDQWEGRYYIVNGQHRSLGARKRGETEVVARVLDLRGVEDPAAVEATFRLRTNVRMSDKPLERFKAQLRSGNPESVAIVHLLKAFDAEINVVPDSETGINAVATVERLYRIDQGGLLRDTLQVIKESWGYVGGKNAGAAVLNGIAWFISKHADETDRQRVVDKLRDNGREAVNRRAMAIAGTMGGSGWMNVYRAIVDFYNEKLHDKSKLEWRMSGSSAWKGAARWAAHSLSAGH